MPLENEVICSPFDIALDAAFFRSAVGWDVERITSVTQMARHPGVRVERLELLSSSGTSRSIVAKLVPQDASGRPDALRGIHQALYNGNAPVPESFWFGEVGSGAYCVHVMEDLSRTHHVYSHDQEWTLKELLAIAEAVARFHAAGFNLRRSLVSPADCQTLERHLHSIDGSWLCDVVERAHLPPINYPNASALEVVRSVGERYADWQRRISGWDTVVHTDIFSGNVALQEVAGEGVRAKLLDLDEVALGIPHYDVEYMTMRGWRTESDASGSYLNPWWDVVRRRHFDVLQELVPGLADNRDIWYWGYQLALVQIMLVGTRLNIDRLDRLHRGDVVSAWEMGRIRMGDAVFDADFLAACGSALENDPWR